MKTLERQPELAVEDKLSFISKVMDSGEYAVVVKESCTLFEVVFRKIFQQAIISLPYKDRAHILEIEKLIGKGNKGIHDFGFGELVGLYRESKLLDKWSKYTSKDLGLIRSLDFSSIVTLRNKLTHEDEDCSRSEALIVYEYLRSLLAFLGYNELEESINNSFKKNNPNKLHNNVEEGKAASTAVGDKLPKIVKTGFGKSVYSSSYGREGSRLKVQGNNTKLIDIDAFNKVLKEFPDNKKLVGLDVGCAAGYVTATRFGEYPERFLKVAGIDFNEDSINKAEANYSSEMFSFYKADIEDVEFEDQMDEIMAELDVEGFDVIFSSLTIHHLGNPTKALLKMRKLLNPDGYIILRGSDDGSKIGFPDNQNLIRSVIQLTMDIEGVSDRENGRKLFNQLWKSGFRDIQIQQYIKDTSNMNSEERYAVFEESFSYRKNYFKKRLDKDPANQNNRDEYEWILAALEELEFLFLDASFYYSEMDYIAISRK